MTNIGERFQSPSAPNLSDLYFPATDNDILREIKTTNELLKIMIYKMDEILVYLKGNTTTSSL